MQKKQALVDVSKIEIYHVEWGLLTYASLSCEDLRKSSQPIIIKDSIFINKILSILNSNSLNELIEFDGIDPRVCCLFYDKENNIIKKISFAPTKLMEFDGKVYNTIPQLFELVVSHLPEGYLD